MTRKTHKAVSAVPMPETLQETAARVSCEALRDTLAAHRLGIVSSPALWADLVEMLFQNAAVGARPMLHGEN
jgi:hypothetical protein